MRKIKRTELPTIKKTLVVKQRGACPICGKDITRVAPANLVLDHDHDTGIVRAVLHRGCNGCEGKLYRLIRTWGKAKNLKEVIETLENIIKFWKLHKEPQTEWIYPSHKTSKEKREALNRKRRKIYAKKQKGD